MAAVTLRPRPLWNIWRRVPALLALVILALVVLVAIGAPLIAPHSPYLQDLDRRLAPPLWAGGTFSHVLG